MEKELEQYRQALRLQNKLLAAAAAAMAILLGLGFAEVITPAGGDGRWADSWNGFLSGVSAAVILLAVTGIVRNHLALRDAERLRKQYIKEHDERACEIARRAGSGSYWFESLGLLLAVAAGGYFSPLISLVCLGCLLYICLVRLGLKLYYNRVL